MDTLNISEKFPCSYFALKREVRYYNTKTAKLVQKHKNLINKCNSWITKTRNLIKTWKFNKKIARGTTGAQGNYFLAKG